MEKSINFEHMMAAAERDVTSMNESGNNNIQNIKETLNNIDYSEVISKLANNPSEVAHLVGESASQLNPTMMEQARKQAMGSRGEQIKKELLRQGIDNRDMKNQLLQQKKEFQKMNDKTKGAVKQAILITSSKLLNKRNIAILTITSEAKNIICSDDAVEISCSRIALGNLSGMTIKAWYDPKRQGKNVRASKIIGFKVAGDLLVIMEEGDLSETDFLAAEKQLM